jgi:thioredoxin 1
MASPEKASLPTDFDNLLASHKRPILVDFWAEWCQPCHAMAPALKQLAQEWKGRITVIKIDTEKKPDLAGRYGITGIPTLILFKDGKEAHRSIGAMPFSRLQKEFESYL